MADTELSRLPDSLGDSKALMSMSSGQPGPSENVGEAAEHLASLRDCCGSADSGRQNSGSVGAFGRGGRQLKRQ